MKFASLEIYPPLALAPMVGLSHSALRQLVIAQGGVGLLFTEMLDAARLPQENALLSPLLHRTPSEKPLIYQLFLADDAKLEPLVAKLADLAADGIDLNLGCPAPQLRRHGAGAYLADDRAKVERIVAKLRRLTSLPISAKIRLGRELDEDRLLSFCRMLAGEGIDLLTVHGRLHGEKFGRKTRWDWIGRVKKAVAIPVLANGGIFTVADARECLAASAADGLMLGRGAAERPWLFAEIAREVYGCDLPTRQQTMAAVYFDFVDLVETAFLPTRRLGRVKQFTHYFAHNYQFGHHLASAVQTSPTIAEARTRAAEFFKIHDQAESP